MCTDIWRRIIIMIIGHSLQFQEREKTCQRMLSNHSSVLTVAIKK